MRQELSYRQCLQWCLDHAANIKFSKDPASVGFPEGTYVIRVEADGIGADFYFTKYSIDHMPIYEMLKNAINKVVDKHSRKGKK